MNHSNLISLAEKIKKLYLLAFFILSSGFFYYTMIVRGTRACAYMRMRMYMYMYMHKWPIRAADLRKANGRSEQQIGELKLASVSRSGDFSIKIRELHRK